MLRVCSLWLKEGGTRIPALLQKDLGAFVGYVLNFYLQSTFRVLGKGITGWTATVRILDTSVFTSFHLSATCSPNPSSGPLSSHLGRKLLPSPRLAAKKTEASI